MAEWKFKAFGTNSTDDASLCGHTGSIEEGVRLYSLKNSGKIVKLSMDGLSYYYTQVPADKNFTLRVRAVINDWSYTNGQEGFGVMACDSIGSTGGHDFWNNSVMAAVTRYNYFWDSENACFTDDEKCTRIEMAMGVCALGRYGVTAENYQEFRDDPSAAVGKYFKQELTPLEHICAELGDGAYNILGEYVEPHSFDPEKSGQKDYGTGALLERAAQTPEDLVQKEFILSVSKNNSGYTVTYETEEGIVIGKKTYYDERFYEGGEPVSDLGTALEKDGILETIEKGWVNVGFFAARNMDVTFFDAQLSVVDAASDDPTRNHKKKFFTNNSGFFSSEYSNVRKAYLTYLPTWRGTLTVMGDEGDELYSSVVEPGGYVYVPVSLITGENGFVASFLPDQDYHCGNDTEDPTNIYNCLSSYDEVRESINVHFRQYGEDGGTIYVSKDGSENGDGSRERPLDVFTAVHFARPGQTILMEGGVYELDRSLKIERGIDGTREHPIRMAADPESGEKVVLDFSGAANNGKLSGGFLIWGCYWHIEDLEVRNAPDINVGVWVAGSFNVIRRVIAHHNGNVGICILTGSHADRRDDVDSKGRSLWPHDNLIIECESYENADSGGDLADGFACKIKAGDGNIFENCVSHHNADDGFDLYTKSESGRIGKVVIKGCMSYMNGYVHRHGILRDAGNGNGFKLGGESIPGGHIIENCVAYKNKGKGIDSNRCPDPKVYDCMSIDNGRANFALYTIEGKDTDFRLERCRSVRTDETGGDPDILQCGPNQSVEDVIGDRVFLYTGQ